MDTEELIDQLSRDLAAATERIAVIEEAMSDVMKTCVATVQLVAKAAEVAAPPDGANKSSIEPATRADVLEMTRAGG